MFDGTLEYMQANNIVPMAYSPLGKYYESKNTRLKKVIDILQKNIIAVMISYS